MKAANILLAVGIAGAGWWMLRRRRWKVTPEQLERGRELARAFLEVSAGPVRWCPERRRFTRLPVGREVCKVEGLTPDRVTVDELVHCAAEGLGVPQDLLERLEAEDKLPPWLPPPAQSEGPVDPPAGSDVRLCASCGHTRGWHLIKTRFALAGRLPCAAPSCDCQDFEKVWNTGGHHETPCNRPDDC